MNSCSKDAADDGGVVSGKGATQSTVSSSTGTSQKFHSRYWLDEVQTKRCDLVLLACCFVQGLLDCTVFHNWFVFVGMQTGNTVILCLSTAGYPAGQPWAWAATLISIFSFFIGAFTTTRLATLIGPKRRLVLVINFFLQAILIVIAAGLTSGSVTVFDMHHSAEAVLQDPRILIGIAPLAFQSGATIATSRLVGYGNEIPVTVFTSTYAALAGDMKLFQLRGNAPRNRRLAAVVCILGGALSATWIEKRSIGMAAIVWFAAGIKIVLSIAVAALLPNVVSKFAVSGGSAA